MCEKETLYIGSYPYPENIFIDRNGTLRFIEGRFPYKENLDLGIQHFESIIDEFLLETKAKTNNTIASIISGAGGFMIGYTLGTAMGGGKAN